MLTIYLVLVTRFTLCGRQAAAVVERALRIYRLQQAIRTDNNAVPLARTQLYMLYA